MCCYNIGQLFTECCRDTDTRSQTEKAKGMAAVGGLNFLAVLCFIAVGSVISRLLIKDQVGSFIEGFKQDMLNALTLGAIASGLLMGVEASGCGYRLRQSHVKKHIASCFMVDVLSALMRHLTVDQTGYLLEETSLGVAATGGVMGLVLVCEAVLNCGVRACSLIYDCCVRASERSEPRDGGDYGQLPAEEPRSERQPPGANRGEEHAVVSADHVVV
jgi:hypothetical protein